jgi:hypothetical protein
MISALDKYFERKQKQEEELKNLKEEARSELVKQIAATKEVLDDLTKKHIELTGLALDGRPPETRQRRMSTGGAKADFGSEQELENFLKKMDGHKADRKALNGGGYNLVSAVRVAKSNLKKFGQQQNRSQGSVWLVE